MDRKYHGRPDEFLGTLGDIPFPLPLRSVVDIIISIIFNKVDLIILINVINRLPYIFYIVPEHLASQTSSGILL